ncbi:unnamed protein product [Acanthocheilonema viteae]|uniref:Uncharacterized protein n=1 Tax=Acanthocheilonema viteae TaxID=6277 RepID=A0A498SP11_ACAVI|nr:unnamed protein product [Acanthocheilonema viteae]
MSLESDLKRTTGFVELRCFRSLFGVTLCDVHFQMRKQMNTLGQKHEWNSALAKEEAETVAANSTVVPAYLFSRERQKVRSCYETSPSGLVGQKITLEKRYFEPTIEKNFKHPPLEKQAGNRIRSVSFSFKVSNTRCIKDELIMSSVRRNYSDTDLKPCIRTIIRGGSSSDLLEKAGLERTKATLISKLASDDSSTQDSSSEKNPNTSECILKSDFHLSCSSDPKKRKLEVLLTGKIISATPSLTASDKVTRNGNKCLPRVIRPSYLSTALNRKSEWEKVAIRTRSAFLKQRSQKMLKERLKKYRLTTPKSHVDNGEKLSANKATPVASYLAVEENTNKIPFSSPVESLPLDAVNKNSREVVSNKGNVKELSVDSDIKDDSDIAEIEVKREVELLVQKALLQTASSSHHRPNQGLVGPRFVQEDDDLNVTENNDKLKKMWALVAEESTLTNNLNDITAKMNKIKMELFTLSNKSFQIKDRLDKVRLLKIQLLNNSFYGVPVLLCSLRSSGNLQLFASDENLSGVAIACTANVILLNDAGHQLNAGRLHMFQRNPKQIYGTKIVTFKVFGFSAAYLKNMDGCDMLAD